MELNRSLEKIIVSKTRFKLLKLFFGRPKESFYIREVVRITGEELNSVRRELNNLKKSGVLQQEFRGNRVFYFPNQTHPLFQVLLSLVARVEGLGGKILASKSKLGEIKFVIFSGRFLRWADNQSDVDFLVVGRAVLPEIGELVVEEEARRGREINYAVMDLDEFKLRKRNRDPFLLNILMSSPVVILGNELELATT